jgi:hypothetical protein
VHSWVHSWQHYTSSWLRESCRSLWCACVVLIAVVSLHGSVLVAVHVHVCRTCMLAPPLCCSSVSDRQTNRQAELGDVIMALCPGIT